MNGERRQDWEHGVDQNLAALNAGQRVWERENEAIYKLIGEFDRLMRGDPDKVSDGLIGKLQDIQKDVNLLTAVVLKDGAGNKGLQSRVQILEDGQEDRRLGWSNITKIAVALIMAGLVGRFYGDVWQAFNKKPTDPISQMIDRAKHPQSRYRHYTIRNTPSEKDQEDETSQ